MLAKFDKPLTCQDCSLYDRGHGYAPASGPVASRLLFVGEALGYQEAMGGSPFLGAAGGMLHRIFGAAGLSREQVKVDNCVRCQPPGDWLDGAPWQHSALTHCRQYLQESLDEPNVEVVVTLGSIPLRQILDLWGMDGVRVQDFHGTVHRDPSDRFWVVPTYHPSYLQRGATNLFDVVRFDLSVAQRLLASRAHHRRPVNLLLDSPLAAFSHWVDQQLAQLLLDPTSLWLAVDIETPDKEGGRDEGELTSEDVSTIIHRVNLSTHPDEGWTVPYADPYISEIHRLLAAAGTILMWNKRYDEPRLRMAGAPFSPTGEIWDLMWAAHHLQSDWPLGLGFWAPFCSDYGAWKHLGKQRGREAEYAAVDAIQTTRCGHYIVGKLVEQGLWEAFYRHTHVREQYVLRPAYEGGVGVDIPKLDAFHEKLQAEAAKRLSLIQAAAIAGTLKPKQGYKEKPDGPPPASIIGKAGKKGDTAKQEYIEQGVELVERDITVEVRVCHSCGKSTGVGPKHNCLRKRGKGTPDEGESEVGLVPVPDIRVESRRESRWFWQLPFNPDAPQQILNYIRESGEAPGKAKKTKKDTTNKETLRKLHKKTGDPVYLHILDYKAVKKVDSTYALGAKKRIWADGRLHPVWTARPSTFRDSYTNPNIQNAIADKDGKESLAAGFRHCIVASPGCRLIEIDYAGIEAVDTGWLCGDPNYIRLATLGVHAYLTSFLLAEAKEIREPASLSWSDHDLAAFFKDIKKKFPKMYDKAKRCVHGNNYGLTIYGMVQNFPEVFSGGLKEAERVQGMYYSIAPKLPEFHARMRDCAYENGYLGGPYVDDYYLLAQSGKHHPFSYRHYFYGVQSFRPIDEAKYRKLQWIARKRLGKDRHPKVVIINGRPFEIVLGEDSKRVIAFPPQSIAAGTLKEAEINLLHPDSPTYIGEIKDGKTPLLAPIHDSLLLDVPDHLVDWVISLVVEVMRQPILRMPCPKEWGVGSHLRVNVDVKVGPKDGSWAEIESVKIPDMAPATASETLYLPVDEQEYEDIGDLETPIEARGMVNEEGAA